VRNIKGSIISFNFVQHTIIIPIFTIMATIPLPFLRSGLVSGSGFSLEEINSILEALEPKVRGNT
jgi:hypothetical protein